MVTVQTGLKIWRRWHHRGAAHLHPVQQVSASNLQDLPPPPTSPDLGPGEERISLSIAQAYALRSKPH